MSDVSETMEKDGYLPRTTVEEVMNNVQKKLNTTEWNVVLSLIGGAVQENPNRYIDKISFWKKRYLGAKQRAEKKQVEYDVLMERYQALLRRLNEKED